MELARRSGVSPSYVSLIEHGEKIPSEDVAVRIARVLGEREDTYRVWAATARMDDATREAVWRMRGTDDAARSALPGEGDAGSLAAHEYAPDSHRPPGRPRVAERYEFQVSYKLQDDERAPTLRIPLLVPGSSPLTDPPPQEEVEALVGLDARLFDRSSAAGLVAMRVDETNGREVVSWLRPRDLVVIERHPSEFDPTLIHAFVLPEGLRFARASLTAGMLIVLADPTSGSPARMFPGGADGGAGDTFFGTVLWSGRLWPLA